jgi:hypothetical protein
MPMLSVDLLGGGSAAGDAALIGTEDEASDAVSAACGTAKSGGDGGSGRRIGLYQDWSVDSKFTTGVAPLFRPM